MSCCIERVGESKYGCCSMVSEWKIVRKEEMMQKWDFDGIWNCAVNICILWKLGTFEFPGHCAISFSMVDSVRSSETTRFESNFNWRLWKKILRKRNFPHFTPSLTALVRAPAKLIECFSRLFEWKSEKRRFTSATSTASESDLKGFLLKSRN